MITDITNDWYSPVRRIKASVGLYEGSTHVATYTPNDVLKSFTIERLGEMSKFFGFGVCQKANVKILDPNRQTELTTAHSLKLYLGANDGYLINSAASYFNITEVHRNENTNELSITAYDAIYKATGHTFAELGLSAPYYLRDVIDAIALFLGLDGYTLINLTESEGWASRAYDEGANVEGTENLRQILNAIAEATQSIYYIDNENKLVFKRLDINGSAVLTIGKEDYIELSSKSNRRLSAIVSATELGDNVGASLEITGTTQYVRDNPFWDLRNDIAAIVDEALAAVGGMVINQFECNWRGNYSLEIGDKIALVTKDGLTALSYVLNDTLEYSGGLRQKTSWSYTDGLESPSNPSTLGDALKQTYAKVDKVNQEIELVAAETAQLKLDAENVKITINQIIEEDKGVTEVTTTTGFTFNQEGLKVTKSDSEINTTITEDGMVITKGREEMLVANNEGVKAEDLHATTYLIIGENSRIEDYADNRRTGCFWIGK